MITESAVTRRSAGKHSCSSVFQDPSHLRYPSVPLTDTASLIGQAVNQLPEGHADYNMAIALVELVHSLM